MKQNFMLPDFGLESIKKMIKTEIIFAKNFLQTCLQRNAFVVLIFFLPGHGGPISQRAPVFWYPRR